MLPFRHLLLTLLVVTIWGSNFVAIKIALRDLPPLLLCTARFVFVAFPAVFFLPRPKVPFRLLLLYGLSMFAGQFGLMFLGMKLGMSAGVTSLVLQFQVLVTLAFAATVLNERVRAVQVAGAFLAIGGFVVVGLHTGGDVTVAGFICILLAGFSWAVGNLTSKRLGQVNALSLVAWGSLVVPLPMGAASYLVEGPELIRHSLSHAGLGALFSVAYIVYFSTLVAYSLWSWLLARHPVSLISPFTLLLPIVAMLCSAVMLGEPFPFWKFEAAALVLAGLALNVFGPRFLPYFQSTPALSGKNL